MILKVIKNVKAEIVSKAKGNSQPVYYARCNFDGKEHRLLIKSFSEFSSEPWFTIPCFVVGDVIFYDDKDDLQKKKFRVRFQDKYPNSRIRSKTVYPNGNKRNS